MNKLLTSFQKNFVKDAKSVLLLKAVSGTSSRHNIAPIGQAAADLAAK